MKSFHLKMPQCPRCASRRFRFNTKLGAILFLAAQLLTSIGIGIHYICKDCGHHWVE